MSESIDWSGARRQPCPACSRGPKDRTCGVTIDQGGSGVAHCFRCEYVETLRDEQATKRPGSRQARTTASLRYETLSEFGSELWRACGPIVGVSAAYLAARCRQRTGTCGTTRR